MNEVKLWEGWFSAMTDDTVTVGLIIGDNFSRHERTILDLFDLVPGATLIVRSQPQGFGSMNKVEVLLQEPIEAP